MSNAVVCTMTESEYRSLAALNASRFKAFVRSPYHFFNQKEVETTENMKIGTAIHTALLEPSKYLETVAYLPEIDRRTTEGKRIAAEFEAMAGSKLILKAKSEEIVNRCVKAVAESSEWQREKANKNNRYEQVLIGEMFGINCKAKLDIIDPELGWISDVKSCQDCSHDKFRYDVKDRMYWVQAAFYSLLAEKVYGKPFRFSFCAVETDDPAACCWYTIPEAELNIWKAIVGMKLNELVICQKNNVWESYKSQELGSLNLKYDF